MFAKNAITATRVVYQRQRITIPSTLTATHVEAFRDQDEDDAHVEAKRRHQLIAHRDFHATCKSESATIAAGLAVVAITAKASQYGIRAYEEWKKNQPEEPQQTQATAEANDASSKDKAKSAKSRGKSENIFTKFFGVGVGSKYYEGGFEEKMTRREAALILGVRESASAKRIKEAHRKILILNHPDTGGSTYMASKINEAKELLLKGK